MSARRQLTLAALGAALAGMVPAAAQAQRVVEVQVAPPFLRLRPGTQAMVLATAYDREGMPVDAKLFWTSTNINVATVDSMGAVHALAPGLAVITAATDTGAVSRRHSGRTTILVMGNEPWIGAMPHDDKRLVDPGDTIPPAQCSDPDFGMRNEGRQCWDRPPRHYGPIFLEAPAACSPPVTPPVFWARIEADGHVSSVRALNTSTCATYQSSAEDFVKSLEFVPARRNGRQVGAWTIVAVRSINVRVFVAPPQPPGTPNLPNPDKTPPRP